MKTYLIIEEKEITTKMIDKLFKEKEVVSLIQNGIKIIAEKDVIEKVTNVKLDDLKEWNSAEC